MIEYTEQIQRIKNKLREAKEADTEYKVFGAHHHQYYVNTPATQEEIAEFEQKFSIQLPNCYRAFISEVGNGGEDEDSSGAGPFYGIYPLDTHVSTFIYDNPHEYLKNECILYRKMTNEFWESLTQSVDDTGKSSDDYNKELGKIYGGILPIGMQGCTYYHGLVLNGKYKGRVVNVDIDGQKPHFTHENNFLDWYERWLDEVISGALSTEGPHWFGFYKGGSEEELLHGFVTSCDVSDKEDCIDGLLNKGRLTERTLNEIERLINDNVAQRTSFIQLLCKSDYVKAKPYMVELSQSDLLSALQFVHWHAKEKSHEWLSIIEEKIGDVTDEETFRLCTSLLTETKSNYGRLLVPFMKNNNKNIRMYSIRALGELQNKKDFLETFIEGLNDESNRVVSSALQALSGINDKRLLKYYRDIAIRFPVEENYILLYLNHRLQEYGFTNETIITAEEDIFNQLAAEKTTKKWYEIWK